MCDDVPMCVRACGGGLGCSRRALAAAAAVAKLVVLGGCYICQATEKETEGKEIGWITACEPEERCGCGGVAKEEAKRANSFSDPFLLCCDGMTEWRRAYRSQAGFDSTRVWYSRVWVDMVVFARRAPSRWASPNSVYMCFRVGAGPNPSVVLTMDCGESPEP